MLCQFYFNAKANFDIDTAKINAWNILSEASCPTDLKLAIIYADSAIELSNLIDYQTGIGDALMYKGLAYDYAGVFDSAILYYDSSIVVHEKGGNIKG